MTGDVRHLPMCLLAIYMSFLEQIYIQILCLLLTGFFGLVLGSGFAIGLQELLMYFTIYISLSGIWFARISLHFITLGVVWSAGVWCGPSHSCFVACSSGVTPQKFIFAKTNYNSIF